MIHILDRTISYHLPVARPSELNDTSMLGGPRAKSLILRYSDHFYACNKRSRCLETGLASLGPGVRLERIHAIGS